MARNTGRVRAIISRASQLERSLVSRKQRTIILTEALPHRLSAEQLAEIPKSCFDGETIKGYLDNQNRFYSVEEMERLNKNPFVRLTLVTWTTSWRGAEDAVVLTWPDDDKYKPQTKADPEEPGTTTQEDLPSTSSIDDEPIQEEKKELSPLQQKLQRLNANVVQNPQVEKGLGRASRWHIPSIHDNPDPPDINRETLPKS